jgi:PAS domain-containing protein
MGVRRLITLSRVLSGQVELPPDYAAEFIALAISILMLAGIYWIGPLFVALKKSEEESRQEASELRSTYESSPDLIFRLDPDGRILKYHALDEGELSIPQDELLGKKPSDFLPTEVTGHLDDAIQELAKENGEYLRIHIAFLQRRFLF